MRPLAVLLLMALVLCALIVSPAIDLPQSNQDLCHIQCPTICADHSPLATFVQPVPEIGLTAAPNCCACHGVLGSQSGSPNCFTPRHTRDPLMGIISGSGVFESTPTPTVLSGATHGEVGAPRAPG